MARSNIVALALVTVPGNTPPWPEIKYGTNLAAIERDLKEAGYTVNELREVIVSDDKIVAETTMALLGIIRHSALHTRAFRDLLMQAFELGVQSTKLSQAEREEIFKQGQEAALDGVRQLFANAGANVLQPKRRPGRPRKTQDLNETAPTPPGLSR